MCQQCAWPHLFLRPTLTWAHRWEHVHLLFRQHGCENDSCVGWKQAKTLGLRCDHRQVEDGALKAPTHRAYGRGSRLVRVVRESCCSFCDYTHLARLFLIFSFASSLVPFITFYQTYDQLEAAMLLRVGYKKCCLIIKGLYICGEGFAFAQYIQACWLPAVVFMVPTMLLFGLTAANLCRSLFFVVSLVCGGLKSPQSH